MKKNDIRSFRRNSRRNGARRYARFSLKKPCLETIASTHVACSVVKVQERDDVSVPKLPHDLEFAVLARMEATS
jgi:hypothetical protein